jgi:DNA invertase Pin-like site-specific DNA recombinase
MKTAACYIRVSTDEQTEYSPDSQLKAIQQYCERNDILLLEDCVFAEDGGKSGKDMKHRTEFQRLISLSKKKPKPFDIILVWKFSRFARNQEESIVVKSMLQKQNIEVVSISEPIPDNAFGSLIERIIEWSDEYYLTNLSEEVKRGMKERASRGEPVTPPPIGYKLENGTWVPDEQADFVTNIFKDYLNGLGLRAIATKYANIGLRTKRGNAPDNRFIEYILHNPVYIGKIRWSLNGRAASTRHYNDPSIMIYDGKHPPLIDLETFEAVQIKLENTKKIYSKYQRSEQTALYMLKGLVRCSNCGATLTLANKQKRYFQCHNYARGSCQISHCISENKLNTLVIDYLQAILNGNFPIKINQRDTTASNNDEDYKKLLDNERKKLQRVKLAYQNGIDTIDEYKTNKATILKNIKNIELAMTKRPTKPYNATKFKKQLRSVVEILNNESLSPDTKNKSLRLIIENIVYNKANKTIDIIFYT